MAEETEGKEVGQVTHFFDKVGVAVVELTSNLKIGSRIRIKGTTTDFEQEVKSMQIQHEEISEAKKGDAIGMKTDEKVRVHDKVFILE